MFKRKYISGDPAKLKDYSDAELALMEAEKIFNQLHALGKEATRIKPIEAGPASAVLPPAAAQRRQPGAPGACGGGHGAEPAASAAGRTWRR
ncbi:hypothetical protein OEZ85_010046 [Tetradesmus obliquus]|uniref:Uncharacterized protein n=1 Tax=Tetradesmus obliquus TaxID=3088 RepID=A0ABY8TL45_TETOB|nr:hypothetical protein OEZ85_010046 [Tetradesmus obliquus]